MALDYNTQIELLFPAALYQSTRLGPVSRRLGRDDGIDRGQPVRRQCLSASGRAVRPGAGLDRNGPAGGQAESLEHPFNTQAMPATPPSFGKRLFGQR